MNFQDRYDAGRQLGMALAERDIRDAVVLGLARGGVPVAYEVAVALDAPLDVLVVRKVGAPGNPEFGLGAVAEDDVVLLDGAAVQRFGGDRVLEEAVNHERDDLDRRVKRYRGSRPPAPVLGRTAIVVDDGIATGGSAIAGVRTMRKRGADKVIVAAPVAAPSSVARLRDEADDVVCLEAPEMFLAVGSFYGDFEQTSDEEVVALLERAHGEPVA
jgi:predicted phosphoribosyltransferase